MLYATFDGRENRAGILKGIEYEFKDGTTIKVESDQRLGFFNEHARGKNSCGRVLPFEKR